MDGTGGARVLLVGAAGRPLAACLADEGHRVVLRDLGRDALADVVTAPDLVLLDLDLPDMSGIDACRRLRRGGAACAIVVLTVRGDDDEVVAALEAGGDEVVTLPVGRTALLARVHAHLRRAGARPGGAGDVLGGGGDRTLRVGDLAIDDAGRRCTVAGLEVPLRAKEFQLLRRLAAEPGVAVRRDDLMHDVWDACWFGSTKTLDVHVASLRRRLAEAAGRVGPATRVPAVVTLRGYGYRLDDALPGGGDEGQDSTGTAKTTRLSG